jgi:hypothetical protein
VTALSAVPTEVDLEFDRQVDALATTGFPALLDLSDTCFRARLEPLRDLLPVAAEGRGEDAGRTAGDRIPFVVVVPGAPVRPVLDEVTGVGGSGFTTMDDDDLARFRPLPELGVPEVPYLLVDVDTGPDTLGATPAEVAPVLAARGRTPLTLAEGLAVLVTDPGVLRSRNCFSLLGSRCGDKRVPALWVSARRPRLGWCYQGAPHTWLGTASSGGRLVPALPGA